MKKTTNEAVQKTIRFDIPDRLVAKLKRIAKSRGQTLNELIRETLAEVVNG